MPYTVRRVGGKWCVRKVLADGALESVPGACHAVRADATAHARALWAATDDEIVAAKAIGDWTFDKAAAEHVHRDGARLPLGELRPVFDERVEASRETMRGIAQRFVDGKMDAAAFEREMRAEVKALHLQGRMMGAGGRDQMTQSEWGKSGYKLRQEYAYLNQFTRDLEAGRMTPAGIVDRAGKYAGSSAVDQFEEARRGAMRIAGYTEKRRVSANDSGTCVTCRDEASRGWVPIDEPGWRIGHTACQSRDRCSIEYRKPSGEVAD